jgi:hypothetical protein
LVGHGNVGRQLQTRRNTGQEKPRAELGIDETGVFTDPTESGVTCEDALLHVVFVDEDGGLERLGVLLAHPGNERIEPLRQDQMVILAPGVARDVHVTRAFGFRVIHRACDDDRSRRRQEPPNIRTSVGRLVQVHHVARVTLVEPLTQPRVIIGA